MASEDNRKCPKCGAIASPEDDVCKYCASPLPKAWPKGQDASAPEVAFAPPYERKLSFIQRFVKLVVSPSEAMQDIAMAPSYEGFFVILAVEFVLVIAGVALVSQKIQYVGPYADRIYSLLSGVFVLALFMGLGLYVAKWLIKSLIVKSTCDGTSGWDFRTVASVVGYAYLGEVIVGLFGIAIGWLLIPSFTLDTGNLEAAVQAMNSYRAQLNWLRFVYTLPTTLLGLAWKSYLGGLGVHFASRRNCSVGKGSAVFFLLGSVMVLISFVFQY